MRRSIKTLTITALIASALGISTQSASAYAISGGSYTATGTNDHTFTLGGAYTVSCSSATFTGIATGAASTNLTPTYSGCDFFGFSASIAFSGSSTVTVTGDVFGVYHVRWHTSATLTIDIPSTGCHVTMSGTREFTAGTMRNYIGGATADLDFSGIPYTASGCPFSSGSDGSYSTNGDVDFPGITVS